jgi:hypothetical protein
MAGRASGKMAAAAQAWLKAVSVPLVSMDFRENSRCAT